MAAHHLPLLASTLYAITLAFYAVRNDGLFPWPPGIVQRMSHFEMEPTFTDSQLNPNLLPKIKSVRLIGATVCSEPPAFFSLTRSTRVH